MCAWPAAGCKGCVREFRQQKMGNGLESVGPALLGADLKRREFAGTGRVKAGQRNYESCLLGAGQCAVKVMLFFAS